LLKKFSKGMLQRVGIAQALLGNPRLLILDEVFSGLDPVGRRDIRDLLLEHKKTGATIFFSSHELTEVARLCDRIILVDAGKKLEEHRLEDLLGRLQIYRLKCRGSGSSSSLPTEYPVIPLNDGRFEVVLKDLTSYLRCIEVLISRGYEVLESETSRGSLEDYFVEAIGGKIT